MAEGGGRPRSPRASLAALMLEVRLNPFINLPGYSFYMFIQHIHLYMCTHPYIYIYSYIKEKENINTHIYRIRVALLQLRIYDGDGQKGS